MNQNQQKSFFDNFKNPNGSYHIPVWLIVLGFCFNWLLGLGLLVAHLCEDEAGKAARAARKAGAQQKQAGGSAGKRRSAGKKVNAAAIFTILGIIALFAGVMSLPDSVQYLVWCMQNNSGVSYGVQDVATDTIWIISGGVMLLAGELMRRAARRRKKIAAIVGDAEHMQISEIAEALPATRGKTRKYLQQCIDYGVFGEKAYLDMRSDCLVVRGPAPESKRQQAARKAAEEAARKAEANMDEYDKILKELRDINDKIPGEEFSAKIDRLEDLTAKIFRLVQENPGKLGKLRKFINYYLPTSLKLLRQYEQLDAQGIEGRNISESKRQIEQTMDTMITAFENQLDAMFASESMDISADIAAMQNLMRADGLLDNEFTDMFE